MSLTKKQRAELFAKYDGKCAYCSCELPEKWHADHIEPVKREFEFVKKGSTYISRSTGILENPHLDFVENMNPSCPECNHYKSSMPLESFRRELSKQVERAEKSSKNFRFALKYNQVKLTPQPIIFYFELYQKNNC